MPGVLSSFAALLFPPPCLIAQWLAQDRLVCSQMGRACGWRKGCWDGGGRCTWGFDRQALTTTYIMDSASIFWLHSSFDHSSTLWASPVWCCMKIGLDNEGCEIQFGSQRPSGNSWGTEKWWRVWLLQFGRPSSNHSVSGVFFTKVQTKQNNTHTHPTTQQDKHATAWQPGVLVDFGSSANLLAEEMASAAPTFYFSLAPQLSFDPTLLHTASILKP